MPSHYPAPTAAQLAAIKRHNANLLADQAKKQQEQQNWQQIRQHYQSLPLSDRPNWLASLSQEELKEIFKHPDIFLFDKQIIPDTNWTYCLLRCGRGMGKSYTAAAWIAKKIRQGAKRLGIVAPTLKDLEDTNIPNILSWFFPEEFLKPNHPYDASKKVISFANGAKVYGYSSEIEKKGMNLEFLVCDEIATWCEGNPDKIKLRYEDYCRAVRVGKHPQVLITSTPKPHPFFFDFQEHIDKQDPHYLLIVGSLLDNPTLSKSYVDKQIAEFGNTARGRQELFGELIKEDKEAFWQLQLIEDTRQPLPMHQEPPKPPTNAQLMGLSPMPKPLDLTLPVYLRTVIGFDPSGSATGDECGIIVVSLYRHADKSVHAYVREDASGSYTPTQYANLINQLYTSYQASCVVVESNFGGKETFRMLLRTANALMHVKTVHTQTGKTTRAEHIASLYSQGKVHHISCFPELEKQMVQFNVNYTKSPDRLDALGFALTEAFFPQQADHTVQSASILRQLHNRLGQ